MFSNSTRANSQSQQAMQQMLTRLRETAKGGCSSSELGQLIKDIDDAIAYSNDAVVRRALKKIGLSSEEMISLLQESRRYVNGLENTE